MKFHRFLEVLGRGAGDGQDGRERVGRDWGRDGGRDREWTGGRGREPGWGGERGGRGSGRERERSPARGGGGGARGRGDSRPREAPEVPRAMEPRGARPAPESFTGGSAAPASSGGAEARPQGYRAAAPLPLEELQRKRDEAAARPNRPVFLSKAQRAAQKQEREAAELREKQERKNQSGRAMPAGSPAVPRPPAAAGREPRAYAHVPRERVLRADLRQQYMGEAPEKAPVRQRKGEKRSKFNFGWDATEDTSRDADPLYDRPKEATLLFGRGVRGGVDLREQQMHGAECETVFRDQLRRFAGLKKSEEDRQQEQNLRRRAQSEVAHMQKSCHWSTKSREEMTERDWRIFREDFHISFRGSNVPKPFRDWEEMRCHLPSKVMQSVLAVGYKKPSPIQMAAVPVGLQQRDVIGLAETGSGKTCAFLLPMLNYISKQPPMQGARVNDGPYALVMAPTRELALQIEEEAVKFAKHSGYSIVSIVGGQSIEDQGFRLRKGCEIVVATPGRLVDCLQRSYAVLNQCDYVVLDEADRMIDMGFLPQVQEVLDAMPSSSLKPDGDEAERPAETGRQYRTTYMFSATMPIAVERLAKKYLRRPVVVTVGSAGKTTSNVTQRVSFVKETEKLPALTAELSQLDALTGGRQLDGGSTAIVFVNTQKGCDQVMRHLQNQGFRCVVLHGGKAQDQREAALESFKSKQANILVATDVAGRGIDVPDVALVVNYDMPEEISSYTHRIGRTGRAGKKGAAVSFATGRDSDLFAPLVELLKGTAVVLPREITQHESVRSGRAGLGAITR